MDLRRHALAYLRAPGWSEHLACPPDPADLDAARAWFAAGRPAVVRRYAGGETIGVPLGIPLPPRQGKRRVRLRVGNAAIARIVPPVALEAAIAAAPAAWAPRLRELDRRLAAAGVAARVYGSLAWQRLTGEAYVTPDSDVDLLLAPATRGELDACLRILAECAGGAPRIDGEIVLPCGAGVAWRELAARPREVLARSLDGVRLLQWADVDAAFRREDAACSP
jgi:phosphoribosyl-dephospho-CoA transferase